MYLYKYITKIRLRHQIDPNVQCLHTHLNSKNATGNGVLQTYRSSKLVNNQLTWSIFMLKILKFFDTITNISYTTFLKKIEKLGSRLEVEYFQACLLSFLNVCEKIQRNKCQRRAQNSKLFDFIFQRDKISSKRVSVWWR